jgi:sialidase-1
MIVLDLRLSVIAYGVIAMLIGGQGSRPLAAAAEPAVLFARDAGTCYRIPALAGSGATLVAMVEARHGKTTAKAERGRIADDCADFGQIDLVARTSRDGGRSWGRIVVAVDHRRFLDDGYRVALAGNPTLVAMPGGARFLLLFSMLRSRGRNNSEACFHRAGKPLHERCEGFDLDHGLWSVTSEDGGVSWSAPSRIELSDPKGPIRPGPGHGVVLPGGRIVAPAYKWLLLSDDGGRTWRKGAFNGAAPGREEGPALGGSETSVTTLADGGLWSFMRLEQASYRALSPDGAAPPLRLSAYSRDGGETYERVELDPRFPMGPVNSAVATAAGRVVVSYPRSREPSSGRVVNAERRALTLSILDGGGRRTLAERLLAPGSAGYSDLAPLQGAMVGVLYEGALRPDDDDPLGYLEAVHFTRVDLSGSPD